MSASEREIARLGDRVVTTTSHTVHNSNGVFARGPGLYGTVAIEDFGGDPGRVYVDCVASNGKYWGLALEPHEYRVVRRAPLSSEGER